MLIQFDVQSLTTMQNAKNPEEAAKVFMAAATKGLPALLAKAVQEALASSSNAMGNPSPAIAGWEKLITGFTGQLAWETPMIRLQPPSTCIAFSAIPAGGGGGGVVAAGINGSISVTIGGSF